MSLKNNTIIKMFLEIFQSVRVHSQPFFVSSAYWPNKSFLANWPSDPINDDLILFYNCIFFASAIREQNGGRPCPKKLIKRKKCRGELCAVPPSDWYAGNWKMLQDEDDNNN